MYNIIYCIYYTHIRRNIPKMNSILLKHKIGMIIEVKLLIILQYCIPILILRGVYSSINELWILSKFGSSVYACSLCLYQIWM